MIIPTAHPPTFSLHVFPQGMAADKAKLEFVKLYYEFPSKVLYSDTRA